MTTDTEALGLQFNEAVQFFRQKARIPTDHWTDLWKDAHSRGFMVAGAASDALLADFQKAIAKALEQGTTLEEFRRDFDKIVEKHGWAYNGSRQWRSRIIYETNLSMAYSAGQYAQMTEPHTLESFPYWQYVHSGSRHPRLQHLAWNGLTLRADDPFWNTHYPPNGWRCGCRVRPCGDYDLERMGKSKPDTAPPMQTRPWRNPKTGIVSEVPLGIDPGFDYNPGLAWKQGTSEIPTGGTPAPVATRPLPPRVTAGTAAGPIAPSVVPEDLGPTEEADRTLKADADDWGLSLRADEAEALAAFKGAAGQSINEKLRDGVQVASEIAQAERIRRALERSSLKRDVRAFRGVDGREAHVYRTAKAGAIIRPPAFFSTSIDEETASRLVGVAGLVVQVLVPKGLKGVAYVHPYPGYRFRQYEVLLNMGLALRVLVADKHHIVLEATGDQDGE